MFDFLIKTELYLFWMKILSLQQWLTSHKSRRREKLITREGKHKNKTKKTPSSSALWGWGNECVSCDALGFMQVVFLLHFHLSKIRGWSVGDVNSAFDSPQFPVRHRMNFQISLGLTCKTVITFFVYLNYLFVLWVSTRLRVTGP